jgi:hypothetical protein
VQIDGKHAKCGKLQPDVVVDSSHLVVSLGGAKYNSCHF